MMDGIIKYNFDFQQSSPLKESQYRYIEELRVKLYALGLIGVANGIGYGNISQRVDRDSFVITGTQTGHIENLNAKHYSLIEEYNDKKFYLKSSGAIKPSSEALTHGTIYNLSGEIGAVIHIHSKKLWDFMLDRNYLKTAVVEYGSIDMIDEVNRIFSDIDPLSNPKFVMAGHEEGVMVFAKDLSQAEVILLNILRDFIKSEN